MSVPSGNVEYWDARWSEKKTGWHQTQVDKYLLKHLPRVTGKPLPSTPTLSKDDPQFLENSKKTWFVPLCGKTLDIPFLLGLGYKVFGAEGVRQAIDELNQENNFGLIYDEKSSMFTRVDGRLQIYLGDLFKLPIQELGPFDYVWDRGSLVAVEYQFRPAYKDVVQRALKKKDGTYHQFTYLLNSVRYDKTKHGGPPRSLDEEDMDNLFGDWTNVEVLEVQVLPPEHRLSQMIGQNKFEDVIYLITPK